MNNYYTYAYLREDGTPYYIGKGKGCRINGKHRKNVKVPPKERRIYLKQNLTEAEAFRHEIYMIAVFGRKDLGTGILINLTDGGGGTTNISEETRKKLRKAATKYKTEKERKEAIKKSGREYYERNKEKLSEYSKKRYKKLSSDAEWFERQKIKQRIPKEKHKQNRLWKTWKLTFADGRVLVITGLYTFCKENNYSDGSIYKIAKGKGKRHKDIVAVEKLDTTP